MINTLSEKELNDLKLVKLKENETLFNEGDVCTCIGIVKNGSIKISSFLESGKELVFNIFNNGDVFGNNLIFSKDKYYMGDVIALKDSEVYLISEEELLHLLKSNSSFLISYLSKQANTTKSLNFTLRLLSFDNAKERFMFYLRNNNDEIEFDSVTALASNLHLTREATSRTISYLLKNKVIIKQNNKIKAIK